MVTRRSAREITVSTDRESVDSHADNPVGVAAVTHAGARCTYVIDTSVLLSDPWALNRFDEHEVVLPLVVIGELEAKRHHPELGYFARQALRLLDNLRIEHGRLDAPVPVGTAGGTLHVELNHTDAAVLPAGFRNDSNDSRILACALNLAKERPAGRVILVSKDMPLRVKASAVGLAADEYRAQDIVPSGWTGMAEAPVSAEQVDTLFHAGLVDVDEARELPCHTGVKLVTPSSSALGRVTAGQAGPAGPRGAGGLRPARPVGRAADRARPADGRRGRHRLARRAGRHRQVRDGAVRRAWNW